MENTHIEWADHTINFMIGCNKVSEECDNCYADAIENHYGRDFTIFWGTDWVKIINDLKKWKGSRIFANSMTDMFHVKVPDFMVQSMFKVMKHFSKHQFLILTKRPDRMAKYSQNNIIPDNVWLGTSIGLQKYADERLQFLRETRCKTKFISFEPVLGSITKIDLRGIDWMIIGGESGHGARPMQKEWVYDLIKLGNEFGVKIFFKQWGGNGKCACHDSKGCCLVDGIEYKQFPLLVNTSSKEESG